MTAARSAKRPFTVAIALAVVGGLAVVSVLPGAGFATSAAAAYAASAGIETPVATADEVPVGAPLAFANRSETEPQAVDLDENVQLAASSSVREVFDAESKAQQIESMAAAFRTQYIATPGYIGDDYPWAGITWGQSSLNYTMGQCTDFVAWRLNRDVGSYGEPWALPWSVLTPNGGNARDWLGAWEGNGWLTSTEPVVGAVAWFGYGANHVAYVSAVNGDGTILIEEYNWDVSSGYGARTVAASSIPTYLYPPG